MTLRRAHLGLALALAAALPAPGRAASCCGGGGSGSVLLPRSAWWMVDVAGDLERYDGLWDDQGNYLPDPPGTRLRQWRTTLSLAGRLARTWQAALSVPWVWNANAFSGLSSRTTGPGDTTLALWWEALDEKTAWRLRELGDLVPNLTIGPSILVPTGVSPYDDVSSSFDITGRGFYRIDGNLVLDKGYRAFGASLTLAYGIHLGRPVNRLYGKPVEPFRRRLGDRASASLGLSYRYILRSAGDSLTGTATWSWMHEAEGVTAGARDGTFAMEKHALGLSLLYGSTDHPWSVRASWSHAFQRDGLGENFPTTDIFGLGVRYAR